MPSWLSALATSSHSRLDRQYTIPDCRTKLDWKYPVWMNEWMNVWTLGQAVHNARLPDKAGLKISNINEWMNERLDRQYKIPDCRTKLDWKYPIWMNEWMNEWMRAWKGSTQYRTAGQSWTENIQYEWMNVWTLGQAVHNTGLTDKARLKISNMNEWMNERLDRQYTMPDCRTKLDWKYPI